MAPSVSPFSSVNVKTDFTMVPTSSSVLSTEESQVNVSLQVVAGLVGSTIQHSLLSPALPDGFPLLSEP